MTEANNTIPLLTLQDGHRIPQIGLGTWKCSPDETEAVVMAALDAGYRHIDCAFIYGNEVGVGNAMKGKLDGGSLSREDMFVTSKLWNTYHGKDDVKSGFLRSLESLQLEYLDLFLIHTPVAYQRGDQIFPKGDDGYPIFADVDYIETWKGMECLVEEGLVRSIGLSNFNEKQIRRVLEVATIKPVINQIEVNPYFTNTALIEFCKSKNITVVAYSPLGPTAHRAGYSPGDKILLEDPVINAVAKKHRKAPSQVAVRYAIDKGLVVLTKSSKFERIKKNIQVFDFHLDEDDIVAIDNMNQNQRTVPSTMNLKSPYYPF
ncbi:aldo-keto reductase 1B-like [Ptychodera flava]|uniref:aldo-keto reductase 1B-like n=1 Tax=Ptychodera flava TaxID=63121 RepID=UPI00396A8CA9